MIGKPIETISKDDIDSLIQNQVREGRTIEYKQALPGKSPDEKREFLADVSSFANASGGDLIYGITESEGIPQEAKGVKCNADQEILRLESLIRSGIDPRIPGVQIRPIDSFSQGPVIVIHIPRSWSAPHMVTLKNRSRFFTRNSAGKYQMDVTEIRSAFLLSEVLSDKMKRFRDERLARIIANDTPELLMEGPKLIIHLLPAISFSPGYSIDSTSFLNMDNLISHFRAKNQNYRYNIDGYIAYSFSNDRKRLIFYIQMFHSGQMECFFTDIAGREKGIQFIQSSTLERYIVETCSDSIKTLKEIEVPCPILIQISILNVKDTILAKGGVAEFERPEYYRRDSIILPDILIDDYTIITNDGDMAKILKPIINIFWNAYGYAYSLNYDEAGNWKLRR